MPTITRRGQPPSPPANAVGEKDEARPKGRRIVRLPVYRPTDDTPRTMWPYHRPHTQVAPARQFIRLLSEHHNQQTMLATDENGEARIVPTYPLTISRNPNDPNAMYHLRMTSVWCSRLLEQHIAIICCSHYCNRPCPEHSAALEKYGWARPTVRPPLRSAAVGTHGEPKARKRKAGDAEDDDE